MEKDRLISEAKESEAKAKHSLEMVRLWKSREDALRERLQGMDDRSYDFERPQVWEQIYEAQRMAAEAVDQAGLHQNRAKDLREAAVESVTTSKPAGPAELLLSRLDAVETRLRAIENE
jgi:hypothetical protein